METKKKAIDLVAYKEDKKIAFEIETGKNSKDQILENITKSLASGVDKVYLLATNENAYHKLKKLLSQTDFAMQSRVSIVKDRKFDPYFRSRISL